MCSGLIVLYTLPHFIDRVGAAAHTPHLSICRVKILSWTSLLWSCHFSCRHSCPEACQLASSYSNRVFLLDSLPTLIYVPCHLDSCTFPYLMSLASNKLKSVWSWMESWSLALEVSKLTQLFYNFVHLGNTSFRCLGLTLFYHVVR